MVNLCFFFSYLHLVASQVTRMKKATVHIFSPLHKSIILEMSMVKPALHKSESTSSPMRKKVGFFFKKEIKRNKNENENKKLKRSWCPSCVGIHHIPSLRSLLCYFLKSVSGLSLIYLCFFSLDEFSSFPGNVLHCSVFGTDCNVPIG